MPGREYQQLDKDGGTTISRIEGDRMTKSGTPGEWVKMYRRNIDSRMYDGKDGLKQLEKELRGLMDQGVITQNDYKQINRYFVTRK